MNNNIQEDYCSFEVSKLLKEKGFNCSCKDWYDKDGNPNGEELLGLLIYRATHALTIKWIRENFGIHIYLESWPNKKWFCVIEDVSEKGYTRQDGTSRQMPKQVAVSDESDSPEEATEAALLYTLQNLIP